MSRQMQKTQKTAQKSAGPRTDRRARIVRTGAGLLAGFLAALMLLSFVLSAMPVGAASQDEIDDLRDELSQAGDRKDELEAEIDELAKDKTAILQQIEKLDERIEVAEKEITLQEQLVQSLGEQIAAKQAELEQAEQERDEQYENMKSRVRFMVENGSLSYLNILLSADDFSDFLSRYEIVSQISTYEQKMFDELRTLAEQIAASKAELEQDQAEQQEQLSLLETNKQQLDAERSAKDKSMQDLENAESDAKQAYAQIEAEEDRLNEEIKKMIAELASQSSFVGGEFFWPLPASNTYVTCPYGMRYHPITGVYKLHTGVDLRASTGTKIYAANDGTVVTSTYSNAYGNYVVINHGGGVSTLYAHMSRRGVSKGDTVSRGDVIGYVGSTGYSTGPHLHFEIIENGNTIDPMSKFN